MLFQTYEEEEFDAIRKHLNVNKKYEEWNFQSEIEAEVYFHIVENYDVEFFTNYVLKDGIEVDFYFPKHKLIIELDGLHHNTQKYQVSDEERDQMLFHKFSDADLEIETIIRLKLENLSTYKTLNYIDDFFKQAQIEKYDYDFNSLY
ncbi:MAG: DUF559 domain-containing protein [Candidatus Caenarcaniphilales bacterium]|nr:DUF559 domain-containing protein [Candidatus Caenarcaniphilales bacterium]